MAMISSGIISKYNSTHGNLQNSTRLAKYPPSKIYQNNLHMHTIHLKEKDMHRKPGTKI